jgi:hypothetical protein
LFPFAVNMTAVVFPQSAGLQTLAHGAGSSYGV